MINNPHYPFLSTLLMVLLPKCPFYGMAYTGAITRCSAISLIEFSPKWTSYISIFGALLTMLMVAWRDVLTLFASLLIARAEKPSWLHG